MAARFSEQQRKVLLKFYEGGMVGVGQTYTVSQRQSCLNFHHFSEKFKGEEHSPSSTCACSVHGMEHMHMEEGEGLVMNLCLRDKAVSTFTI